MTNQVAMPSEKVIPKKEAVPELNLLLREDTQSAAVAITAQEFAGPTVSEKAAAAATDLASGAGGGDLGAYD